MISVCDKPVGFPQPFCILIITRRVALQAAEVLDLRPAGDIGRQARLNNTLNE